MMVIKKGCQFFVLLLSIFGIFAHKLSAQKSKGDTRPNIIFILTDDQRWDAIGYAGNKLVQTPQMDLLAREGTYFKNAFTTTPICAASRASIITGLYERTHKYTFQTDDIGQQYMENAYPALLKKAGYFTGFFGKFGVKFNNYEALYHVWDDYDRNTSFKDKRGFFYKTINKDTVHLTRFTGQQGLNFIDQAPADIPFCLQLSFSAPHAHDPAPDQYFWQPEQDNIYQGVTMPQPVLASQQFFDELPTEVKSGFNRKRWTWRFDTPEKYQTSIKGYYRMIAGVDAEIAKLKAKLKEKGLDKNTVIIFMSDNGYFLGERQLADKWLMYENSIRIPLIIYDPRKPKHSDIETMALNIDIPATITDLAGIAKPKTWQGKSLASIVGVDKGTLIDRDTILIEHLWEMPDIPPSEGVRTKKWKYFRYVNNMQLEYLYDLEQDPQETNNLVAVKEFNKIAATLKVALNRQIDLYRDPFSSKPKGLAVNFVRKQQEAIIGNAYPYFSWIVPDLAKSQTAYQVLVATSKEAIDNNIADVWNSKVVSSAEQANIPYAGPPLNKEVLYFWKVRIWDKDKRLSEYSESQSFRINSKENAYHEMFHYQVDTLQAVIFKQLGGSTYFADFGKHAFGTVLLNYYSNKKDSIVFHLGEQLLNGRINQKPGGSIRYQKIVKQVAQGQNRIILELKADQRNTKRGAAPSPAEFPVIMPFRYCEVETMGGSLKPSDIRQLAYHGFWEENNSSFTSSDSILNAVWDFCKYSIKATSFNGLYIDGDRERIPYEADAYLNQLSHYGTDREFGITRNTIAYFMQYPTWPTEWQLHVALMMEKDYEYTGNASLISQYYQQVKVKSLMGLADENGLISTKSDKLTARFMADLGFKDPNAKLRDIVDWPPAQKDTEWKLATPEGERDGYEFMPFNTVINCLYYKNLRILARFAIVVGKEAEAQEFEIAALKTKQSINALMFDTLHQRYTDGIGSSHSSLHANMMALAFDVVPKDKIAPVVSFMKTRKMACSVYGAQYLMEAFYHANEQAYALKLLTDTSDRSWYNMIKIGATISLEAWDMKYKPNSDWNHAWGAAPANVIPRLLWGIQPLIPGGSIISITPKLATLKNSQIKVPFLKGIVSASYHKISETRKIYEFILPANVSAELNLPLAPNEIVKINGNTVDMNFPNFRLSSGKTKVEVIVNTF